MEKVYILCDIHIQSGGTHTFVRSICFNGGIAYAGDTHIQSGGTHTLVGSICFNGGTAYAGHTR